MTDLNGPKIGVSNLNFNGIQKQTKEVPEETSAPAEEPKITDFSDPKGEALGRVTAMGSTLFKGADNINHDLRVLLDNPEIAENSDKVFETAFKAAQDAGVENPYEEAAEFSTGNI